VLRVEGEKPGFIHEGLGLRVVSLGFKVSNLRVTVEGSGFRIQGLGLRV